MAISWVLALPPITSLLQVVARASATVARSWWSRGASTLRLWRQPSTRRQTVMTMAREPVAHPAVAALDDPAGTEALTGKRRCLPRGRRVNVVARRGARRGWASRVRVTYGT